MAELNGVAEMMTPKFDAEAIATAQQRNLQAFTQLSTCLATGAQTLMKRQSELVQGLITEQLAAAKDMFSASGTQSGLTKQLAFAQAQAKKALADTEELASIMSATATNALDILYKRTQESMSEIYSKANGNGSAHGAPPARSSRKAS